MSRNMPFPLAAASAAVATAAALAACGGGSDDSSQQQPVAASLTVPKVASCGAGDSPETGLQGQVPAALRTGFKGFNCNLTLVGQYMGEGGNWSQATFADGAGHKCAYHATGTPGPTRTMPGVPVIDITDPTKPVRTTSLTTTAMLDPWESLRVNARRQILIGGYGSNASRGGPQVDIYDLSGDCRMPQLMASVSVGTGADGGVVAPGGVIGHEGNLAPDGQTYYIGDIVNKTYYAVDLTNTTKPKLIASFDMKTIGGGAHGLSVSRDGTRMYGVTGGGSTVDLSTLSDPNANVNNGFVVLDTSDVQQRKPNAQIKLISTTVYKDGSVAQHTLPIKIAGKPYMVMVDEGGSGGLQDPQATGVKAACAAGLAPFPMARIFDMNDETKPALVSKFMLETHDPANCDQVIPDILGLSVFTYGSHYCSVDDRENATAMACTYFNSGIRVFDIRNPSRPKEIAYYNPAASPSALPGSNHAAFGQWKPGSPDWCAARLDFDYAKKQLVTMCQDNGLLVLQFKNGTWPFAESTASTSQN
jgi:hypothetical protein